MPDTSDLSDRTVLLTGATNGIGRAAAHELAALGANLLLVCRDSERAEQTRDEIAARSGNRRVEILIADLCSQREVREIARQVVDSGRPLHVLCNNAGAMFDRRLETPDGVEMNLGLNYLSCFLLTNLLRETLVRSGGGRIVNVASGTYKQVGRLDFDDLESRNDYASLGAYARSKLAMILWTQEIARRLDGTGVTANALNPGLVASNFGQNNGLLLRFGMLLMRPFSRSVEQGAETVVYLCASPEVAGVSGQYFEDCAPAALQAHATNREDAGRLWELSEQL
ncbi:MAG: SDR family oxidoreductase [Myxococcota bacterium]|nr:SDR family oxidoreductase [Myxococcota bacterium]